MINFFKKDKRRVWLLVLFLVLAGGFIKFKIFGVTAQQARYQTETIQRGTLISSVSASGTVSSANSVPVNTGISGVVKQVYVKNGDVVTAGQKIAAITLDQSGQLKQASAWASYSNALNQLQTAQQNKDALDAQMWQDQKSLLDAQNNENYKINNSVNPSTKKDYTDLEKQSIDSALTIAQKSFNSSEEKFKEAGTAITAAQAQATSSWLSYQQSSDIITAPISGTVNGLTLQPGSVISSQSSSTSSSTSSSSNSSSTSGSGPGQKVAVIMTQATPVITMNVSEIDIPKIKNGQKATVTFDALSGKTFTGSVTSIDSTGTVNSGVTTYTVIITLDTDNPDIYPNMSATANIITATKDNVLTVPSGAIQTTNGQSTVRVKKDNQISTVPVETGISSDTDTEIISGLSEGDEVVTSVISSTTSTQRGSTSSPFSSFGVRSNGGFGGTAVRRSF